MPETPAAEVSGLGKRFGRGGRLTRVVGRSPRRAAIDALSDISFTVQRGEVVAVVGGNGAGKSTLLRVLATLFSPTMGTARVAGLDVVEQGPAVRRRVALGTADERAFSLRLTGRENLEFFAALHGVDRGDVAGRLSEVLAFVDLEVAGNDAYSTYSSGMRQRLSLARALLSRAEVLLLDEPFRALDAASAARLRDLLTTLAHDHGVTVVAATHHLDEMEGAWTKVLALDAGRLVYDGDPQQFARRSSP